MEQPQEHGPEVRVSPKPSEPISKKDRVALVLSSLALFVSATTLFLNRSDIRQRDATVSSKASFDAYQMGSLFAQAYLIYTRTSLGNPKEIEEIKAQALNFAKRDIQPIASTLDLRMELSDRISEFKQGQGLFDQVVYSGVRDRVASIHGRKTAEMLDLGYYTFWLAFNAPTVEKHHPQDLSRFKSLYKDIAASINERAIGVGVSQRLSTEYPGQVQVGSETALLNKAVRAKLEASRA
jgi:hypothetical protein